MLDRPVRLAPPPRRLPLSLRILNDLGHQGVWAAFGFTTIFLWQMVANADLSIITFRGPHRYAAARVTRVEETNAKENKAPIFATYYEYSVAGKRFNGVSYKTSSGGVVGANAIVEYDENDPSQSRIEGMRRRLFPGGLVFLAVLPVVAGYILFRTMRTGRRRRHLLEYGVVTTGKLIDTRATNIRVNKKTVCVLKFEYTTRDGRKREAEVRSHETHRLSDERHEPLLYDPDNPSVVFMLDELPSRPKVDAMGELQGRPVAALFALALPGIVILGNALALLSRLGN